MSRIQLQLDASSRVIYVEQNPPKKGGEEKEILASCSCESISFKDVRRKKLFAKRKILQTQIYAKPASDLI